MVTDCHRPEERNKVQAFNDFLIFGTMAVGSFVSGSMLAHYGWYLVNMRDVPGRGGCRRDAALADVARAGAAGLNARRRGLGRKASENQPICGVA